MNQRNRHYDKSVIGRVWHESKVWVHLIIVISGAITAWQVLAGDVAESAKRNDQQDVRLEKLESIAQEQMRISSRIEQKVDYIREDVQDIKREGNER